jgi:hypothetical protein
MSNRQPSIGGPGTNDLGSMFGAPGDMEEAAAIDVQIELEEGEAEAGECKVRVCVAKACIFNNGKDNCTLEEVTVSELGQCEQFDPGSQEQRDYNPSMDEIPNPPPAME